MKRHYVSYVQEKASKVLKDLEDFTGDLTIILEDLTDSVGKVSESV